MRLLQQLREQQRPATPDEQAVLARWSSWGAAGVKQVFDDHLPDQAEARAMLRDLLSDKEYLAARRTVLNAHYTDAALVAEVWDALGQLGFTGGQVLEPGCGSGNFIGLAPETAQITGVELDPTSAAIAAALYPQARIVQGSFAKITTPEASFDAAVGNVPFAQLALTDERHNPGRRHSIHNHFILKALHLTRPGGIVALITSRHTMDAQNPAARREMAELADLVGAVRLPSGAHRRAAGTDVVTDLLILRRRLPGEQPRTDEAWEKALPHLVEAGLEPATLMINQYFLDHPENVLGEVAVASSQFTRHDLEVRGTRDVRDPLARALRRITTAATQVRGLGFSDPPADAVGPRPAVEVSMIAPQDARFEGFLRAMPDGTFTRRIAGVEEPYQPPAAEAGELRSLLEIRDVVMSLNRAEEDSVDDTPQITALRARLNTVYDAYVAEFGPVKRFTEGRQMRQGWHVFGDWCEERGHTKVPATAATVTAYLEHLRELGCDAQLLQRHLKSIVAEHGRAHEREITKALKELRTQLTKERVDDEEIDERVAAAQRHADRDVPGFLATYRVQDVRLPPGVASAAAAVVDTAPDGMDPDLDLDEVGLRTTKINRPGQGGFRDDPHAGFVRGLETFDPTTQTARKATIFTQRVRNRPPRQLGADTPEEALTICLDTHSRVVLDEIARLLGLADTAAAREALGELVYDDPATGEVLWAKEYLSGNVRRKLAVAQSAADTDSRYAVNVEALRKVVPADLGPAQIEVQLGAWIGPADVQAFARELLGDPKVTVERPATGLWHVDHGSASQVIVHQRWGTQKKSAYDLLEDLLLGKEIRVMTPGSETSPPALDLAATEAAKDKAEQLNDAFAEWVWQDPDRAERLARYYNDRFNAEIPRDYSGVELALPGYTHWLPLREHQKNAVAAMIYEPAIGIAHDVGAGKTLEIIVGFMERRRRGLSTKPMLVVPNDSIADQFETEWRRAYPNARLLLVTSDEIPSAKATAKTKKPKSRNQKQRTDFVAKVANDDWDAIIITKEAFEKIPVRPERQEAFLAQEVDELRKIQDNKAQAMSKSMVAQFEQALTNAEERLTKRLADINRDPGATFEDTEVDYLGVDEAQLYKNGLVITNLPGMAIAGSNRAIDLDMKLAYFVERFGKPQVCLATATPFTRAPSEIFLVKRRLGYELDDFDSWARTFYVMADFMEMKPGGALALKSRMRGTINETDLWHLLRVRMDIKQKKDLGLKLPQLRGGKVEILTVESSPELEMIAMDLVRRQERLPKRPKKGDDTHLKVLGDGIKAALDVRMLGLSTEHPQKVDVLADDIEVELAAARDNVYHRSDGTEHPVRGGLILVFCDLSVPSKRWNFYRQLKDNLIARGVPEDKVRFIHEANSANNRADLLAACREGGVSVLVGSTMRMGVGLNVQDRIVGGYEVTLGWNPDISHQARGRAERQGNQNEFFFWKRMATAPSLDAKYAEINKQKEDIFAPLMASTPPGRSRDVNNSESIGFADLMAAATGDPRYIEKFTLDREHDRLRRARQRWTGGQRDLKSLVAGNRRRIERHEQAVTAWSALAANITPTAGDAFRMTVDGTVHTERVPAADALRLRLLAQLSSMDRASQQTITVGSLGGLTIRATLAPHRDASIILEIADAPDGRLGVWLDHRELPGGYGIVTRLENLVVAVAGAADVDRAQIDKLHQEITDALPAIDQPFPQAEELTRVSRRREQLLAEISETATVDGDSEQTAEQDAQQQAQRAQVHAQAVAGVGDAADGEEAHRFADWYADTFHRLPEPDRPTIPDALRVWRELPVSSETPREESADGQPETASGVAPAPRPAGNPSVDTDPAPPTVGHSTGTDPRDEHPLQPETTEPALQGQSPLPPSGFVHTYDPVAVYNAEFDLAEAVHHLPDDDPRRTQAFEMLFEARVLIRLAAASSGHSMSQAMFVPTGQAFHGLNQVAEAMAEHARRAFERNAGRNAEHLLWHGLHLEFIRQPDDTMLASLSVPGDPTYPHLGSYLDIPVVPSSGHDLEHALTTVLRQFVPTAALARGRLKRLLNQKPAPAAATPDPPAARSETTRESIVTLLREWAFTTGHTVTTGYDPGQGGRIEYLVDGVRLEREQLLEFMRTGSLTWPAPTPLEQNGPAPEPSAERTSAIAAPIASQGIGAGTTGHGPATVDTPPTDSHQLQAGQELVELLGLSPQQAHWLHRQFVALAQHVEIRGAGRNAPEAMPRFIHAELDVALNRPIQAERSPGREQPDPAGLDTARRYFNDRAFAEKVREIGTGRVSTMVNRDLVADLPALVDNLIADLALPHTEQDSEWIRRWITDVAADPAMLQAARVNSEDNFALFLDHHHLIDSFLYAAEGDNPPSRTVLDYLQGTDEFLAQRWHDLVRCVVYDIANGRGVHAATTQNGQPEPDTAGPDIPASGGTDLAPELLTLLADHGWVGSGYVIEHGSFPAPKPHSYSSDWQRGKQRLQITWTSTGVVDELRLAGREVPLTFTALRAAITSPDPAGVSDPATVAEASGTRVDLAPQAEDASGDREAPPQVAAQQVAEGERAVVLPTLRGLRTMSAEHDLQVRVVRVAAAVFVTVHEPAAPTPPVLSWPVGLPQAFDGAGRPLLVETVADHLAAYRSVVDAEWFAAKPGVKDWPRRLAQLTPHLLPGPAQRPEVRQHVGEVLAAVADNPEEAERLLRRTEDAAGPVALMPEREAQIIREIRDHASGYAWTKDVGRYLIEPKHLDGTWQEWDWINAYVAAHPDVLKGLPDHDRIQARIAAEHAEEERQGAALSDEANVAYREGDYEQALDLMDQAELAYPGNLPRWSRIRDVITQAATEAAAKPTPGQTAAQAEPAAADARGEQSTTPVDDADTVRRAATPATAEPATDEPATAEQGRATGVERAADPTLTTSDYQLALYAQINAEAAEWFDEQLDASPVAQQKFRDRLGDQAAVDHVRHWAGGYSGLAIGYAPAGWTGLVDHLRGKGFRDQDLVDAGVASVVRTGPRQGNLIDRFRNRLMFGIRDLEGRMAGFTGRDLTDREDAKYLNTPTTPLFDKSTLLFGLYEQRDAAEWAVPAVVEGPFDVLAILATATPDRPLLPVASCGTALTTGHLDALDTLVPADRRRVFAMDGDEGGRKAVLARAEDAVRRYENLDITTLPSGLDPAAFALTVGVDEQIAAYLGAPYTRPAMDVVVEARLALWEEQLEWVEGRVGAGRHVAALLATVEPQRIADLALRVEDRLDLAPTTMADYIAEARHQRGDIPTGPPTLSRPLPGSGQQAREERAPADSAENSSPATPSPAGPEFDLEAAYTDVVPAQQKPLIDSPAAQDETAAHASEEQAVGSAVEPTEKQNGTISPEPASPGRWTRQIEIEVTGDTAVVSGTDKRDPQVLRKTLKDNGFRWRPNEGFVWKYFYRRGGPSRDDAVQSIRDVLTQLDAKEAAKPAPAPTYPPTPQQQAVIDAFLAGRDVAVRALAGTGKTSTMRMLAARAPDKEFTYIAFNRSIADEAQAAFGPNVRADTMHAFARQALGANPRYKDKLGNVAKNDGYADQIARVLGLDPDFGGASVAGLALGAVKRFRESADAELGLRHTDRDLEPDQAAEVLEYARRIWADKTSPDGQLRFCHDDYLKIWALGNPTIPGDVIIFDEVQDVNELQARLVQAQTAQTIVVGDSYQSIYGFRGAKDFLSNWPADVTLPLTKSWRFGQAVEGVGNRFLRLLRSNLMLEGNSALDTRLGPVENPDAVLCRTNAGAVAAVFAAMEEGKRVALVGGGGAIKDIARAAKDLQRKRRTKHEDLSNFASWHDVRDYVDKHPEAQSLAMFVRLVDKHGPDGLIAMADDLVDEDETDPDLKPHLVVSTAHKAKGREWDNVRIADDFKGPTQDETTGETIMPPPDELRLGYVTATRCKGGTLDLGSLNYILRYGEPSTKPSAAVPAEWRRPQQDLNTEADMASGASPVAVIDQVVVSDRPGEPASPRTPEATSPQLVQTPEQSATAPTPTPEPASASGAQPTNETNHPGEPATPPRGDDATSDADAAPAVSRSSVDRDAGDGLFQVSDFDRKPLRPLDPYSRVSLVGQQRAADVRLLSPRELEHRWRVLLGHARALGREVVRTGVSRGSNFDEDGNIDVLFGIDPQSAVRQLEDAIIELVGGPIEVGEYETRLAQARQDGTLPTIAECLTGEPLTLPDSSDPNALVRWALTTQRSWPMHYREKYEVWNSLVPAVSGAGFTEIESTTGTVEVDHDRALIAIPKFWTSLSDHAAAEAVLAMATAVAHAQATRHAQILSGIREPDQGPGAGQWRQRWTVLVSQAVHQGLLSEPSTSDDQAITLVDSDGEARTAPGEQWRLDAALPLRDRVIWLSRRLAADPPPVPLVQLDERQEAQARRFAEQDADQDLLPFLADLPADRLAATRETLTAHSAGLNVGQALTKESVSDAGVSDTDMFAGLDPEQWGWEKSTYEGKPDEEWSRDPDRPSSAMIIRSSNEFEFQLLLSSTLYGPGGLVAQRARSAIFSISTKDRLRALFTEAGRYGWAVPGSESGQWLVRTTATAASASSAARAEDQRREVRLRAEDDTWVFVDSGDPIVPHLADPQTTDLARAAGPGAAAHHTPPAQPVNASDRDAAEMQDAVAQSRQSDDGVFAGEFPMVLRAGDLDSSDTLMRRIRERLDDLPREIDGVPTGPVHLALAVAGSALTTGNAFPPRAIALRVTGNDVFPLLTAQRIHQFADLIDAAVPDDATQRDIFGVYQGGQGLTGHLRNIATEFERIASDPVALARARAAALFGSLTREAVGSVRRAVAAGDIGMVTEFFGKKSLRGRLIDAAALHVLRDGFIAAATRTGFEPGQRARSEVEQGRGLDTAIALQALAAEARDRARLIGATGRVRDATALALREAGIGTIANQLDAVAGFIAAAGEFGLPEAVDVPADVEQTGADEVVDDPATEGPSPLFPYDVAAVLRHIAAADFARLVRGIDDPNASLSLGRDGNYQRIRGQDEPDPGNPERVRYNAKALQVEIDDAEDPRAGRLTWTELQRWIAAGLTPANRQIVLDADDARNAVTVAEKDFIANGEGALAQAVREELDGYREEAITAIVAAALAAHENGGRARRRRKAADAGMLPVDSLAGASTHQRAVLDRIATVITVLSTDAATSKPLSQIEIGDVVEHPGYLFGPFRITAQPVVHDDHVELVGDLLAFRRDKTVPTVWRYSTDKAADPRLRLVPRPLSLAPLLPSDDQHPGTQGAIERPAATVDHILVPEGLDPAHLGWQRDDLRQTEHGPVESWVRDNADLTLTWTDTGDDLLLNPRIELNGFEHAVGSVEEFRTVLTEAGRHGFARDDGSTWVVTATPTAAYAREVANGGELLRPVTRDPAQGWVFTDSGVPIANQPARSQATAASPTPAPRTRPDRGEQVSLWDTLGESDDTLQQSTVDTEDSTPTDSRTDAVADAPVAPQAPGAAPSAPTSTAPPVERMPPDFPDRPEPARGRQGQPNSVLDAAPPDPSATWAELVDLARSLGYTVVKTRSTTETAVNDDLGTISVPWDTESATSRDLLFDLLTSLTEPAADARPPAGEPGAAAEPIAAPASEHAADDTSEDDEEVYEAERITFVDGLADARALLVDAGWILVREEPTEFGGLTTEVWNRGPTDLAISVEYDGRVVDTVSTLHTDHDDPDLDNGWLTYDDITAALLRTIITEAGLYGAAKPAYTPGLWRVQPLDSAGLARTFVSAELAARVVTRHVGAPWSFAALGSDAVTVVVDAGPVSLAPALPRIRADRKGVLSHVVGESHGSHVFDRVAVYVTGRTRGGLTIETAFARLREEKDPDLIRRAVTATAGRLTKGKFDADRARVALLRLAEGDPTLPINSVGHRIEWTTSAGTVSGIVQDASSTPHGVSLHVETDIPERRQLTRTVHADATLALAPDLSEAPAEREHTEPATELDTGAAEQVAQDSEADPTENTADQDVDEAGLDTFIDDLTDARELLVDAGWTLARQEPADLDGLTTEQWMRHEFILAIKVDDDGHVADTVLSIQSDNRSTLPAYENRWSLHEDGWYYHENVSASVLRTYIKEAGLHGIAVEAFTPGLWRVSAYWSARFAREVGKDVALRTVRRRTDLDGAPWAFADTKSKTGADTDAGLVLSLAPPLPPIPEDQPGLLTYVAGDRDRLPGIADLVEVYVTGRTRGTLTVETALKRLLEENDPDLIRRIGSAAAGRHETGEFDAGRARWTLLRLAEGDPTLPMNSVGHRIEWTTDDGVVVGTVQTAVPTLHGIALRIETDPAPQGQLIDQLTRVVDSDAELTLAPGPAPAGHQPAPEMPAPTTTPEPELELFEPPAAESPRALAETVAQAEGAASDEPPQGTPSAPPEPDPTPRQRTEPSDTSTPDPSAVAESGPASEASPAMPPATSSAPTPTPTTAAALAPAVVTLRAQLAGSQVGWPHELDAFLMAADPFTAQDLLRGIARATDHDPHTQVLVAMAWRAQHGQVTDAEVDAFAARLIAGDPSMLGHAVGRTLRDPITHQLRAIHAIHADIDGRLLLQSSVADNATTLTNPVDPDAWLNPVGPEVLPADEAFPLLERWHELCDLASAYGYTVHEQPDKALVLHDEHRIMLGTDSLAERVHQLTDLTEQIVALRGPTRPTPDAADTAAAPDALPAPADPATSSAAADEASRPAQRPRRSSSGPETPPPPQSRSPRRDGIDRIVLVPVDDPSTEPLAAQLAMGRYRDALRFDEAARLALSYVHQILRGPVATAVYLAETVINVGHRGEAEQVAARLTKLADKIDSAGFTTAITGDPTVPLTVHLRRIADHVLALLTPSGNTPPASGTARVTDTANTAGHRGTASQADTPRTPLATTPSTDSAPPEFDEHAEGTLKFVASETTPGGGAVAPAREVAFAPRPGAGVPHGPEPADADPEIDALLDGRSVPDTFDIGEESGADADRSNPQEHLGRRAAPRTDGADRQTAPVSTTTDAEPVRATSQEYSVVAGGTQPDASADEELWPHSVEAVDPVARQWSTLVAQAADLGFVVQTSYTGESGIELETRSAMPGSAPERGTIYIAFDQPAHMRVVDLAMKLVEVAVRRTPVEAVPAALLPRQRAEEGEFPSHSGWLDLELATLHDAAPDPRRLEGRFTGQLDPLMALVATATTVAVPERIPSTNATRRSTAATNSGRQGIHERARASATTPADMPAHRAERTGLPNSVSGRTGARPAPAGGGVAWSPSDPAVTSRSGHYR